MKFDSSRFAAIRARADSSEDVRDESNGRTLEEKLESCRAKVTAKPVSETHRKLAEQARVRTVASEQARKPANLPVSEATPKKSLAELSAEVKAMEEAESAIELEKNFASYQPPARQRIDPAVVRANLELLRSGTPLIKPKPEGETK